MCKYQVGHLKETKLDVLSAVIYEKVEKHMTQFSFFYTKTSNFASLCKNKQMRTK
jgi:hypothetical protein